MKYRIFRRLSHISEAHLCCWKCFNLYTLMWEMGVLSRTCINWIDKADLHACVFILPADLPTYAQLYEWMDSICQGPEEHSELLKGRRQKVWETALGLIHPFSFPAFGFQRNRNRWGKFMYLGIWVALFYFSHKDSRRGEKGWEFERAVVVSKVPQAS